MKYRMYLAAALALVVCFAVLACGGRTESTEGSTTAAGTETAMSGSNTDTNQPITITDDTTAGAANSPGGAAAVPQATAGTTVLVTMEDNSIGIQKTGIPPGPAVFTIANAGAAAHQFRITGPGVQQQTDVISPRAAGTLNVNLQKGTYRVECAVLDHTGKGETATLTVE